ncbi:copper chaperone CopZ [Ornithinibacillus californiensis]|uniref:copper chaperone CopZ n=1 Tax=Ornithinibacillus californiensis TaxID=161536 RepID=UPI00064E0314|nr:copper chaperone CopZ [Ornithinibacillus californiensis]
MQTLTLDVRGMTCGHCKMSVEGALTELEGVSNVEVDLATGNVTVSYDESKVTLAQLQEAVEDQGYDVA